MVSGRKKFVRCPRFLIPKKISRPAQRRPRADAQRNRGRVLEVAKEAFARSGEGTSLDDIAQQAGVVAATLHRHFPMRDALLEAVYRTEVERLAPVPDTISEGCTEAVTELVVKRQLRSNTRRN